jgi:two-component system, OmpR family, sensor histidine kinase BaeS
MFRRFAGFFLFRILVAAAAGALIATGLAALSGKGRWLIVLLTVLVLMGLALAARRMFRRTWTPVGDLIDATRRLGEGDLEARMRTPNAGPFAPISRSFNKMAERLGEEDQRRRRFLADISHELRTPMTVIRGEVEAIIDGLHGKEELAIVIDEIEIVDRLLEDLRLLSMAEAGTLRLETEPTDLTGLIETVVSSFSQVATRHAVEVSVHTEARMPEVEVDPHRIQQVMTNLVANALREMPSGGRLEIGVSANEDSAVVEVGDTGPGIREADIERVFDRFVKAGDSSGTGLGLSISRDLVEAHGGTLTAGNRVGGGAVFMMTLPLVGA